MIYAFVAAVFLLNLVLHEVAHLLASVGLDYRLVRVNVGLGPEVLRFHVRNVRVSIALLPIACSLNIESISSETECTWSRAFIIVAGPAANLALAAAFYSVVSIPSGDSPLAVFRTLDSTTNWACLLASLISLSFSAFNLLPLPPLDGGHLALLVLETFVPKSIYSPVQMISTKIGLLTIAICSAFCLFWAAAFLLR